MASQRGVPWGISECGYNTVDVHPQLPVSGVRSARTGAERGLGDDLVIAPYASALALMVAPEAACSNLQQLAAEGLAGTYGFTRPSISHRHGCGVARRGP